MIINFKLFKISANLPSQRCSEKSHKTGPNQANIFENATIFKNTYAPLKGIQRLKISAMLTSLLSVGVIACGSSIYMIATPTEALAAAKRFTITVQSGKNGSVSPKARKTVTSGTKASYKVTPSKQYLIESLTVNGAPKRNLPSKKGQGYTLTIPRVTENLRIAASFAQTRTVAPLSLGSQISVVDPK